MKHLGKKPTSDAILEFAHELGFNVISEDTYMYVEARFYRECLLNAAEELEKKCDELDEDCSRTTDIVEGLCEKCIIAKKLRTSAGVDEK